MIRKVALTDAQEIVDIYNYYIENTDISFEVESLKCKDMENRIEKIMAKYPFIVYEEDNKILGYAYLNEFRSRVAYSLTVESSIYVNKDYCSPGIGERLYKDIISLGKEYGFHVIIGCITVPNEKSVKLHEKLGFNKVGEFKEVGRKNNKWLDVGFWEKVL